MPVSERTHKYMTISYCDSCLHDPEFIFPLNGGGTVCCLCLAVFLFYGKWISRVKLIHSMKL